MAKKFVKDNELNPYEQECFDEAIYFKMIKGPFKRSLREIEFTDDYDSAVSFAIDNPSDRPWMIYAVTEHGNFAHISNV